MNPNEVELSNNAVKATKNICCTKDEGAVGHSTITKWFGKFRPGFKNFDGQAR